MVERTEDSQIGGEGGGMLRTQQYISKLVQPRGKMEIGSLPLTEDS